MPPLGEGLDKLLPDLFRDATKPTRIDLLCTRKWGADSAETCTAIPMDLPPAKLRRGEKSAKH